LLHDTSGAIRAWHGSPHDFDKFDINKIGSGEGAQAYGHGLYFAENPAVAQQYQVNLGGISFETGHADLDRSLLETMKQLQGQSTMAVTARDATDVVGERLMRQRADALKAGDLDWFNTVEDQRRALERVAKMPPQPGGRLYEVNINAEPEDFLDWDAPLSAQPQHLGKLRGIDAVAEQLQPFELGSSRGESIYSQLSNPAPQYVGLVAEHNARIRAAEQLKQRGIPGLKYLDQGSRGSGNGTRNYVVFDDDLIDILNKY
jgi:hypothetical protein